jgi:hypothetical protein
MIVHKPGMADALMQEVLPLLAAEGIDLNDPETFDLETLNGALGRAIERRNFDLTVATGEPLRYARTVLRIISEALDEGHRGLAEALLWSIEPEPTDAAKASVGQVIGVSAGVADSWHGDQKLIDALARVVIPDWENQGKAAAADILALARKGRAFDSIGALHRRHSGLAILEGGALVVAGSVIAIAKAQDRDVRAVAAELLDTSD